MESKLKQANQNIRELIDGYISVKTQNYDHCCLRIVLLGKERHKKCGDVSCDECNRKAKEEYRNRLLNQYIVCVD